MLNRYQYPDGGIVEAIAKHHGVKERERDTRAGSGEILKIVGEAFHARSQEGCRVDPSYDSVYRFVITSRPMRSKFRS